MNIRATVSSLLLGMLSIILVGQDLAPKEPNKELIHRLLEQSTQAEIEAIEQSEEAFHYNTRNVYQSQIALRGRAGEFAQVDRLSKAILKRHEARNLQRSQTWYQSRHAQFSEPESSPEGLALLIRQGDLGRVQAALYSDRWTSDEGPNPEVTDPKKRPIGVESERFWIACKLAAAFQRQRRPEKVRELLNFAKQVLQGEESDGVDFDLNDSWLPETDLNVVLGPVKQPRITFYWTLVQSGYAELAIDWFLNDKNSQSEKAFFRSNGAFSNHVSSAFIALVATHQSPQRAEEILVRLYGDSVPWKTRIAFIEATLASSEPSVVDTHFQRLIATIREQSDVADYVYVELLKSLNENKRVGLARNLASELVARIEKFEDRIRNEVAVQKGDQNVGYYNLGIYAWLATEVVKFDHELAMKLVKLHANSPLKDEWSDWVQVECVKAQCGEITEKKHLELTQSCFADELIAAYIDSGQMELAKQTIRDASLPVRASTYSGSVIGAGNKGLGILDFNAYERIVIARRAIRFENLRLARALLDEMDNDYNRREGYRAVTKFIARHLGVEDALAWLERTEHPIGKSGASLGVVEFLLPEPVSLDNIPPALVPGC